MLAVFPGGGVCSVVGRSERPVAVLVDEAEILGVVIWIVPTVLPSSVTVVLRISFIFLSACLCFC